MYTTTIQLFYFIFFFFFFFTPWEFFTPVLTVVFHWGLRDSKSSRVSRTHLSILDDFSSAMVWVVSILSLVYNLVNLLSKRLGNFPRAPTTIAITVTIMFHSLFSSRARSKLLLLSSLLLSLSLHN